MTIPLPRHTRAASPPPLRLTPRDIAVLDAVDTYRVLRRDQIQTLFFPSKNTANERLKRLYHHGYLARRWAQKALCYLSYLRSGAYLRRYGSNCLRVITVTSGERRLANLPRTRAQTCEGRESLFWFTTLERLTPEAILEAPIWQVAGEERPMPLMVAERGERPLSGAVPQLLFPS